ncbi:unnamed protein product, partial [marine sediment metagenome]
MSSLAVATYGNKSRFRPGEEVAGKALWILDKEPETVEIRLFWYTEGKGTQDIDVVDVMRIESSETRHEAEFKFTLPGEPYSFSGKLISLLWALEVVVLPSGETERLNITVSPSGNEIVLRGDETDTSGESQEQS